MEAGHMAPAPIWSDLSTFDGRPWCGVVDCLTAGFPCQPWSVAGQQRGTEDERWLWPDIARVLREVRPPLVFLENVPALASGGGLGRVLGSLAELGYDAEWDVFSAAEVGAPHQRKRLFVLGLSDADRAELRHEQGRGGRKGLADSHRDGLAILRGCGVFDGERPPQRDDADGCGERVSDDPSPWPPGPRDLDGWRRYLDAGGPEPAVRRGAHGGPDRVGELFVLGGGVVPLVAAHAFRVLAARAVS
jgi:DNA (cytosine-5)-methyltransferase 1